MSVALVCVVSGAAYERYAEALVDSAREHFRPDGPCETFVLRGATGWPDATLYRYHVLLEHDIEADYVYLCDADMLWKGSAGAEVLGDLVAVTHPGYVNAPTARLPYERRPESAAAMARGEGGVYYAGGFVGGRRDRFLELALRITGQVDADADRGIVAVWHDESHLQRALADTPPTLTLSPSFCYPDADQAYLATWPEQYPRKLVALDKTPAERAGR